MASLISLCIAASFLLPSPLRSNPPLYTLPTDAKEGALTNPLLVAAALLKFLPVEIALLALARFSSLVDIPNNLFTPPPITPVAP